LILALMAFWSLTSILRLRLSRPYLLACIPLLVLGMCSIYRHLNSPLTFCSSVYFPQRSTNAAGLLGYVPNSNKNVIVALQVETHDCIKNIEAIASVKGVDILFLGQNDLCMSMGLV
jgi:hypothetical protein